MTADVLPFAPLPEVRRIKELERLLTDTETQLGQAHEALMRAKDVITSLQEEKSYREFYQWLSTERLKDIADLEQDVKRLERELHERG